MMLAIFFACVFQRRLSVFHMNIMTSMQTPAHDSVSYTSPPILRDLLFGENRRCLTPVQIHQVHICVLNIVGYLKWDKTVMFKHPPKSLILQLSIAMTFMFNMLLVLRDISTLTSCYR